MTAPAASPSPVESVASPAPITTVASPAAPRTAPNNGYTTGRRMASSRLRLTYLGSVRAEFTKLMSIRSTWWLLAVTLVLTVAGAALDAWSYKTMAYFDFDEQTGSMVTLSTPKPLDGYQVWTSLVGFIPTAAIVIGIFGIMAITGEYTNLTIQSALVANPRRGMYLASKGTVVGALAFLTSLVGLVLGWVTIRAVLAGVTVGPLAADQRMLPVICLVGGPVICMVMAWFALGFGALCRSTVGGVFALIGVWMILPSILSIVTMSEKLRPAFQSIANCLPSQTMSAFLNGSVNETLASVAGTASSSYGAETIDYFIPTWWQSGLIFVAWAALVYALGMLVMRRADIK